MSVIHQKLLEKQNAYEWVDEEGTTVTMDELMKLLLEMPGGSRIGLEWEEEEDTNDDDARN